MSVLTLTYALLFYASAALFVAGLAFKISQYWVTPTPLKIPVTPAPLTRTGVVMRMTWEVVFFRSLFFSNKWIWLFGVLFHASLLLIVLRHLRYFIRPDWFWIVLAQPFGMYAGFTLVFGLLGLWARRLFVDRVRYVSSLSDHLMLILIIAIGLSGLSLRYLTRTDIVQVKVFFLGLLRFDIQPLPEDPMLLLHLGLVIALIIIFPFSKLLHAPGIFFHPSRNQVDDAREKRHLADWARPLDAERDK